MALFRYLRRLFNLQKGEEAKEKTLADVKTNISFEGANLWILACAIMIASVGLNVNSTAVIIGAMLISPLMGPILGAGFALGIYDFVLLKRSLRNLLVATVVSLLVSTLYFFISPFKEAQSELLARTSPNIYDVLIAFFGGLVGAIAITRVEKGNPIPGVAIATALMPPLCTAGYGLAIGEWRYFLGALFLYIINCVFICIATLIIVKYLKYPATVQLDAIRQKRVKYIITTIVICMLLPSAYFAFSLYRQQQFKLLANNFIENELLTGGNTLIYKKTSYTPQGNTIELAFLQKTFNKEEMDSLNDKLKKYGLNNTKLIIKSNAGDITSLKTDILNELNKKSSSIDEKDRKILELENKLKHTVFDNKQLLNEIRSIYPAISSFAITNLNIATADTLKTIPVLLYTASGKLDENDKKKLSLWVENRLKLEHIQLIKREE